MRYSDETIFKIAAVRHLEFSKIAIFVMWRVSEHGSTCTYQIARQSDNNSWRYNQKTIFNMAAVPHVGFVVTSSYIASENIIFTFLTLYQIFKSIGLVVSDILGLSCFIILARNCYFGGKNLTLGAK